MTEFLQGAVGRFDQMSKDELREVLELVEIALSLSGAAKDVLRQLRNSGPVEDGDVVSKAGRNDLINCGAAVKICVKGEQGYQACTYRGWSLAKIVEALAMERGQ